MGYIYIYVCGKSVRSEESECSERVSWSEWYGCLVRRIWGRKEEEEKTRRKREGKERKIRENREGGKLDGSTTN